MTISPEIYIQIPDDLGVAWEMHRTYPRGFSDSNMYVYNKTMREVVVKYSASEDFATRVVLSQIMLDRAATSLQSLGEYSLSMGAMEKILDVLSAPGVVQAITGDDRYEKLTAYLLTRLAFLAEVETPGVPFELLRCILNDWATAYVPDEAIHSLQDCVKAVYGPGVWEFYRSEVKNNDEFPYYLLRTGMSPLGMRNRPGDAAQALPSNML